MIRPALLTAVLLMLGCSGADGVDLAPAQAAIGSDHTPGPADDAGTPLATDAATPPDAAPGVDAQATDEDASTGDTDAATMVPAPDAGIVVIDASEQDDAATDWECPKTSSRGGCPDPNAAASFACPNAAPELGPITVNGTFYARHQGVCFYL